MSLIWRGLWEFTMTLECVPIDVPPLTIKGFVKQMRLLKEVESGADCRAWTQTTT